MLSVILGGAGSGKSEFAEQYAMSLGKQRVYVATMQVFDEESQKRVERHQMMRQNKGFVTVESPIRIGRISVDTDAVVLLECMSNLVANEIYDKNGAGEVKVIKAITNGVQKLQAQAKHLVIVSNNIFDDGICYDEETKRYNKRLAEINRILAKQANVVVEVVCGLPIWHKGKGEEHHVASV